MTDPLSLLRAGLDRDAKIARAAAEHDRAEGDPGEWRTDESCGAAEISAGGVRRENGYGGTGVFGSVTVARELAIEDAAHIANFDPARALRQSEKLREAMSVIVEAANGSGPEPDLHSVCGELAELLASIYTEDTDETEAP